MGTESGPGIFGTTSSGVPVKHLDYYYVENCSNSKELEKILKVLRSGEEGHYPELIEFTEKRLEKIEPKSKALHKDLPVRSYHDLEKSEREQVNEDFEDWMTNINHTDSSLKNDSEAKRVIISDFLPPVRLTRTVGSTTTGGGSEVSGGNQRAQAKKKGSSAPKSYKEWDKFDVDEEVRSLEEKEETKLKEKKEKARLNTREAKLSMHVQSSGKTDEELIYHANREKDKGNDAFRCGDFKESLVYYSRSIKLKPTAAAYNNRALTEIRLGDYSAAIQDCNTVIFMEPENLKAFLRRAISQKHIGMLQEAREDLHRVLEIEPNNRRAKELLDEINQAVKADSSSTAQNGSSLPQGNKDTKPQKKGQRLKIIEVDSSDGEEGDNDEDQQQAEAENRDRANENVMDDLDNYTASVLNGENSVESETNQENGVDLSESSSTRDKENETNQENGLDLPESSSTLDEENETNQENGPDLFESSSTRDEESETNQENGADIPESSSTRDEERETSQENGPDIPESSSTRDEERETNQENGPDIPESSSTRDEERETNQENGADIPESSSTRDKERETNQENGPDIPESSSTRDEERETNQENGPDIPESSSTRDEEIICDVTDGNIMATKQGETRPGKESGLKDGQENNVKPSIEKKNTFSTATDVISNSAGISVANVSSEEAPCKISSPEIKPANRPLPETGPRSVVNAPAKVLPPQELPGVAVRAKDEGTTLYKLGRYAESAEKFTEAIDIIWKDNTHYKGALSSLLYNRASCLGRIGDITGCIKDCSASLEHIPGAVKPLLKRAATQEQLEKYKESYLDYQAVLTVDPRNQPALQGNSRVVQHLVSMYGSDWRNKVTGEQPTAVTSNVLMESEKETKSPTPPPTITPRTTSDSNKKTEPQLSATERFKQYKEKGNAFVKQGKHEEAVKCYTGCVEVDPKEIVSYTNRALCYLRLDKNELAETDSTTALEIQADNVKALYRRALARKALGKYDTAAKDLLSLIKIDPKNASGKKELDTVLELCRKERREAQKVSPQDKTDAKKTTKKKGTCKGEKKEDKQSSKTEQGTAQRRRIVIEEVNNDEEDSEEEQATAKTPSSAAKKPTTVIPSQPKKGKASKEREQQKPSSNTTTTSKGSKQRKINLKKATPYDFFQAWNSVKRNDLSSYAEILRQLNPKLLPKVLSNKLDADMFRNVVGAISQQLLPNGDEQLSFEILRFVCQAQRFDMAVMFLNRQDIQELEEVFSKLGSAQTEHPFVDTKTFTSVKNKYKV